MADIAPQLDMRRLGDTGLQRNGGYIQEEWLPELRGARWRTTLRKMVDQDPIIGGILFAIEMLIRRTEWSVTPASDDPADVEAAAFVGECLEGLRPSWIATLPEVLSFLPWGWAALEIVYTRRPDGRIGWDAWEIRAQDTLERWEFSADGRPVAFFQRTAGGREATIPLEKCLHLATTGRRGNPEGRSILRSAYRPWYFKSKIENIEGVGVERDLAGLPVAEVPPHLLDATNRSAADTAIYNAIASIVANIRRDEQEGVVWPRIFDEAGNSLYELKLLSTGGARQFDTGAIIQRYGSQIAMSVLADFLMLGHEQVGSFALSADKTELFTVALGAWLDAIASAVETQAFARLLALNGMAGRVVFTHGSVEQANLGALGAFLTSLTGAGATLFPNTSLLAHLLRAAGLPVDEAVLQGADTEEERP